MISKHAQTLVVGSLVLAAALAVAAASSACAPAGHEGTCTPAGSAVENGRTLTMTLDGVTVSGAADSFGNETLSCVE
jgi:hypothetical protein